PAHRARSLRLEPANHPPAAYPTRSRRARATRPASRALTRNLPPRLLLVMRDSKPDARTKYKRVILKLSGEVLRGGKSGDPIDGVTLGEVCAQVKEIHDLGVEVCVVIGGGNI